MKKEEPMLSRYSLAALALLASAAGAQAATLVVRVTDIEVGRGQVFVGLCDRDLVQERCPIGRFEQARSATMNFRFDGLSPGRWAVAAYQDINDNGRLDMQPILFWELPAEPYGFSNDVGRYGVPTFSGAAFDLPPAGATVDVRLARLPLDDEAAVQDAIRRQGQ